jgi:hypothetical protein
LLAVLAELCLKNIRIEKATLFEGTWIGIK